MNILAVVGGIGGFIILLTAIISVGRAIFKQVSATEDNTEAVRQLTEQVGSLKNMYQDHETRIAILEDRVKR